MANNRPVFFLIGLLICFLGMAMLIPAMVDGVQGHDDWMVFALASIFTQFCGVLAVLTNRGEVTGLTIRQIYLLLGMAWLVLPAFAALPFMMGEIGLGFIDAYFEAVSGITTTGATVLTGLDYMPPGLIFWRSILQWLGGIGVVVMAVSALPTLRMGGMQIFRSEFAEKLDKALPRTTQISAWIMLVYSAITFACVIGYLFTGMSGFDAINHAMTTVATGGFSTHDASFSYYENDAPEWVAVLFMILGSLPFLHYIHIVRGGSLGSVFYDSQVRWFLAILGIAVAGLILGQVLLQTNFNIRDGWAELDLHEIIRETIFNATSIMTGTGYSSTNFEDWGVFVQPIFFALMFIGACAGSTTCGLKVFRLQVLAYSAISQLKRLLAPHGVIITYYNGKPLADGVAESVMGFFFFYVLSFAVIAIGLGMCGLEFITAISGAATVIANVGPGLGEVIGPAGNFQPLPDAAKLIMIFGMVLGRLELYTLLILLYPGFWRN